MADTYPPGRFPPSLRRTLKDAAKLKCVHRAGGFNAQANHDVLLPGLGLGGQYGFFKPKRVDICVANGWLMPGEGWNQYVITEAGRGHLAEVHRVLAEREAAREAKRLGKERRKAARETKRQPRRSVRKKK